MKSSLTIHVETLWTNRAELTIEAKLAQDAEGKPVVVVTTPVPPGARCVRYRVVGTELGTGPKGNIAFTGRTTGHLPPAVVKPTRVR